MTKDTDREKTLSARSIAERHFYLMALPCPNCQRGPFDHVSAEQSGDGMFDIWCVRCRSCQKGQRLVFDRSKLLVQDDPINADDLPVVNPSDRPSELLDVGQWLGLFYAIISAGADETDRKQAQRLGYEAALCLEEVFKFYHTESQLPGPDAFFTDNSRVRFREHPEKFARERLQGMRQKLPSLQRMKSQLDKDHSPPAESSSPGFWSRIRRFFRPRKDNES